MNTKSLQFRLTFWNILAFLLVAFLAFFGLYIVTRKILSTHTDNLLMAHGARIVDLINGNSIGVHSMLTREAFAREFNEIPGMLVIAMDNKGQILNASLAMNNDPRVLGDIFAKTYKNRQQFFTNENISGSQMRFLATPIFDNDNLQGVVLVAHPIDVISKSLDSLIAVLGVTFLILIVPVSLGGYFLIKKTIEPIVIISEKLKRIGSENLDERVPDPKTGDEVQELAQTFNLLLDRLHQAFTRERKFIDDVAHELKTPLSTIRSSVEIALSKPRTISEYQKVLQETLVDINKLSSTLKNVLDLAWSESQVINANETVDLSQIFVDLKDIAVKLATFKKITVKSQIAPNIQVLGKPDKLGQAILNLIDNAIKYSSEGGKIHLNLISDDSCAIVQVKDTGVGINSADLPHIFERFYRGSKSDRIVGSGLGLAIARSIVNLHYGEIKVESKIGKGSVFTISLPLIKSS